MIIDISHHNGNINWDQVAPEVDGVYMKITEGATFVDPDWRDYYAAIIAHGKPVGPYHYADGGNPSTEANHFADVYLTSGTVWGLAPVLDAELAGLDGEWVTTFRNTFRARLGVPRFRVYAPVSMLTSNLAPAAYTDANVTLWPAEWGPTLKYINPANVLWQNSSSAQIPGFLGDTDQYCNGWTPQLDVIGQSAPVPPGHPVSSKIPAGTILRVGSRGTYVSMLQAALDTQYPLYSHLTIDGIYGPLTFATVEQFQKRAGLAVDGIAGPQTLGRLYLQGS